jgi:hypothetical protein
MNYDETGIFIFKMMKFQMSRGKTSWKLLFLLVTQNCQKSKMHHESLKLSHYVNEASKLVKCIFGSQTA